MGQVECKLNLLLKSTDWPDQIQTQLKPKSSRPPRMYGLLKVHKQRIPLLLIGSTIGTPTFDIAKYLAGLHKPMEGGSECHIKPSVMFVEFIDSVHIAPNDILVSLDIVSLYTRVALDTTL